MKKILIIKKIKVLFLKINNKKYSTKNNTKTIHMIKTIIIINQINQ